MKLTWTIFVKDLRRVWIPWLLWLALALADIWLGSRVTHGANVTRVTQFESEAYRGLVHVAFFILGYLLAAWLVQLDNLVNAESEWMNRPISGMRLLSAKLLGALLLMFGPLLVIDAAWWNSCGLQTSQIPGAALESLTVYTEIALFGLFLSSVSRDWLRFLTLTIAFLGFGILAQSAGLPILEVLTTDGRLDDRSRILSTELVWIGLAGLFAATCVQYAYRRIGRTSGVAVIGLMVAALVFQRMVPNESDSIWPANQPTAVPSLSKPIPSGVRLTFGPAHFFQDPRHPTPETLKYSAFNWNHWDLVLDTNLDGSLPGEMYHTLEFDGSLGVSGRNFAVRGWWVRNTTEQLVDYVPRGILGTAPGTVAFRLAMEMPRSMAARAIEGPASLHGTLYLRKLVAKVRTKLPLAEGASDRSWGTTLTIVKASIHVTDGEPNPGGPWKAYAMVNVVGPSTIDWSDHYSTGDFGGYVFWNPSTGEAAYATGSDLAFAYVHGVRLERVMFAADIPFSPKCDTPEKAQAWLDGAQLVWVGYAQSDYYRVPVDIPRLKITVERK